MPTRLSIMAVERSTLVITAVFADEDGGAMTPESLAWTLTDGSGAVINSRSGVSVTAPASSIDIVLSGDDLAMQEGEDVAATRILTLEGTYISSLSVPALPFTDSVLFLIQGLVAVS